MRLAHSIRIHSAVASLAMVVLLFSAAHAENAIRYTNATVQPGGTFVIDMVMENDVVIAGAFVPFRWSTPDITLESVTIIRDRFQGTITDFVRQTDPVARTSGVFWVSGIGIFNKGWVNPGSGVLAQLRFRVSPTAFDQIAYVDSAYVDSAFTSPGTDKLITQFSNFEGTQIIYPTVYRGTVVIGTAGGEPRLTAQPARFDFSTTAGGENPTARTLTIASEGPFSLGWQATWKSAWLNVSPLSGFTTAFPTVSTDINGLLGGVYQDTITLTSTEAINSPVKIPVSLTVTQPDIYVSPLSMVLSGVITPPSVESRSIFINSTGSGNLTWSAFWSSSWLTLTPGSGTTPSTVTASADLAGLEAGTYEDEILIQAPGSANSPQIIHVTFILDSVRDDGHSRVRLGQNVPNPFSMFGEPRTRIKYYLEVPSSVNLAVYDLLGRKVRTLATGSRTGGDHEVEWDGRDDDGNLVASGHYFYRIMTPLGDVTRRVVLIK